MVRKRSVERGRRQCFRGARRARRSLRLRGAVSEAPNGEPKNGVPEGLKRLLDEAGAETLYDRRIEHGTQYQITRGPEIATLNVYTSGKISTGGKPSTLLTLLEGWRLAQVDTKASTAKPVE